MKSLLSFMYIAMLVMLLALGIITSAELSTSSHVISIDHTFTAILDVLRETAHDK